MCRKTCAFVRLTMGVTLLWFDRVFITNTVETHHAQISRINRWHH